MATCLNLRLLAQAARVVEAQLSGRCEAQLEVELDVEVRAVGEGLPASMAGDRRLGHPCHLQGRGASSTERVA